MVKENLRGYYFRVYGFMVDELGLSGSALLIFALIYSFSGDRDGRFTGSREYISAATGVASRTVTRELARLCEMGLVVRGVEPDTRFCYYSVSPRLVGVHEKYIGGDECQNGQGGSQNGRANTTKWQSESAKMATNNRVDNRVDNRDNNRDNNRNNKNKFEIDLFKGLNYNSEDEGPRYRFKPEDLRFMSVTNTKSPEYKEFVRRGAEAALARSFCHDDDDT